MTRPAVSEHPEYFKRYIDLVPEENIRAALHAQQAETQQLLGGISEVKSMHRYAEGKWSIREVVGHIGDTERVFQYRLLAFARGEKQPLPGFDENAYVAGAEFDRVPLAELKKNLEILRASTLALIDALQDEAWDRRGVSNKNELTVRAIAYVILGHERHHLKVLREKYL